MSRADLPGPSRQDDRDRLAQRVAALRAWIEQLEQRRRALVEVGSGSRIPPAERVDRATARAAFSAEAAEKAWASALAALESSARAHESAAQCHDRCVLKRTGDVDEHVRRADAHRKDAEADWQRAAEMRRSRMRLARGGR